MGTIAFDLQDVSKTYRTYPSPRHRLVELLSGGRRRYGTEIHALHDLTLSLEKGGRLGVVGQNGSGKSTLLKILAGVLAPSRGSVRVDGRVSALLELGAGFNPELSGAENIRQFCMLHGMLSGEIPEAAESIIRFSELGDAILQPVRTYSSGMAMRLGFACAVYVRPEILIVDEALSVGDSYFQNKCLHKIKSLLDQGTTFIYVTHAADAVRSLCNEAIWLEHGRLKMVGSSHSVGAAYDSAMFSRMSGASSSPVPAAAARASAPPTHVAGESAAAFEERVRATRTGSGEVRVIDLSLRDSTGARVDSVQLEGELTVQVWIAVHQPPPPKTVISVGITDSYGRQLIHLTSGTRKLYVREHPAPRTELFEFALDNKLCPGEYGLVAGVGTVSHHPHVHGLSVPSRVVDHCAGGARFTVLGPASTRDDLDLWGLVRTEYDVAATPFEGT